MSSEEQYEELGKITEFSVGLEDHGVFGFNIAIDFGGASQGTGWYSLEGPTGWRTLKRLLNFLQINSFDMAKGQYIIAIREDGPFGRIIALKMPKVDGGKTAILRQLMDDEEWS